MISAESKKIRETRYDDTKTVQLDRRCDATYINYCRLNSTVNNSSSLRKSCAAILSLSLSLSYIRARVNRAPIKRKRRFRQKGEKEEETSGIPL